MDLLLQSQCVVVNVNSIVLAIHDGDLVGSTEKTSLKREQRRVSGGCVIRRISKSLPRPNPSRQQRWFAWQQHCQRCAWKDQETFWCYKSIKYKVESSSILIVIVVIDRPIGRTKYNQRRKSKPGWPQVGKMLGDLIGIEISFDRRPNRTQGKCVRRNLPTGRPVVERNFSSNTPNTKCTSNLA